MSWENWEKLWTKKTEQHEKVYWQSDKLFTELIGQCYKITTKNFRCYRGDSIYYLPPIAHAREIIKNAGVDAIIPVQETMDCDDYALLLKAAFVTAGYKDNYRRPPFAVAEAWFKSPAPHATNIIICDNKIVMIVEPQTNEWFDVHDCPYGELYFVKF